MVQEKILKYLSKYTTITKELKLAIEESTQFKSYEKGTVLLKEGSHSKECYFVLSGCIRSYRLKDGEEKTLEFYTEDQVVAPANYGTSSPSNYTLECTEETLVSLGSPELEKEAFKKYPQLAFLSGIIAEKIMAQQQQSFSDFKTSSPEERYLNLLKTRPDLMQRAPQHQIASYLGMKPESLSRIRKRIFSK